MQGHDLAPVLSDRPGDGVGPIFSAVAMLGSDYPKIHARHITVSARHYLCAYHQAAYRPDGAVQAAATWLHVHTVLTDPDEIGAVAEVVANVEGAAGEP